MAAERQHAVRAVNAMLVVYAIKNALNGHRYVGSSNCHERRFSDHRKMLMAGCHHCAHLQRAWNLYGPEAFVFETVEIVAMPSILRAREQFWMDATPKAERYNSAPDARRGPGMAGKHHSESARKRISAALSSRQPTKNQLSALRGAHAGHKHSVEAREKMRAAKLARPSPGRTGHPLTEAEKDRMRLTKAIVRREALLAVWEAIT